MNKNIVKICLALMAVSGARATGFGFEPPARVINNGTYGSAPLIRGLESNPASTSSQTVGFDLDLYRKKLGDVKIVATIIADFLNNPRSVRIMNTMKNLLPYFYLELQMLRNPELRERHLPESKLLRKLRLGGEVANLNEGTRLRLLNRQLLILQKGEIHTLIARQIWPFAQFLVVEVDGEPIGSSRMEDLVARVNRMNPNTILTVVDIGRISKLPEEDKFKIVRKIYELPSSIGLDLEYEIAKLSIDAFDIEGSIAQMVKIQTKAPSIFRRPPALIRMGFHLNGFSFDAVAICTKSFDGTDDFNQIKAILALPQNHILTRHTAFFEEAQKRLDEMPRVQEQRFLEGVRALMGQGHDYGLAEKYSGLVRAMEGTLMSGEDRQLAVSTPLSDGQNPQSFLDALD